MRLQGVIYTHRSWGQTPLYLWTYETEKSISTSTTLQQQGGERPRIAVVDIPLQTGSKERVIKSQLVHNSSEIQWASVGFPSIRFQCLSVIVWAHGWAFGSDL